MRIWIDLWAAPDPLFFRPIVQRLHMLGHSTWITAREFGETTAIAEQCGFLFSVVGRHGGRWIPGKIAANLSGAYRRAMITRKMNIDLAVSFNSYSQGLAAKLLRIPFVTCMDYEYQPANHLAFRLASRVVVPRGFDRRALRSQGGLPHKVVFFDGLKEHIAMVDFRPNTAYPRVLETLGISHDDILVTMRPPASGATYHQFENDLFGDAVEFLAQRQGVKVILLPRSKPQANWYLRVGSGNVIVPPAILDGPNLVYWSDLVVGGGGSMNREAAVLGTRAYTVFRGRMAGVDEILISKGELRVIDSREDLEQIRLVKRPRSVFRPTGNEALAQVMQAIISAAP